MNRSELRDFMDEKYRQYNQPAFIQSDPISIPRRFTKKQDIEIAGLFAATLAWGQRPTIIRNANRLMAWMEEQPHDFILNHSKKELLPFRKFAHRTFNGTDCLYYIQALKALYTRYDSLEQAFLPEGPWEELHTGPAIGRFRTAFLSLPIPCERAST
jgi:uncharacterized protein (TIGR02757 family)